MHKYKMIISYDGTRYGGWQKQKNSTSIQQIVEEKLSAILRSQIAITGSGRTDAGVHAKGQVAHFCVDTTIDQKKLTYSLNCLLPKDIRIMSIEEVDPNFHSRFSAQRKIYHYYLHTDMIADPFKRKYSYHVRHRLDLTAMRQAAAKLIGTHDFSSFANERGDDTQEKNNVRTLFRLDIIEEERGCRLEFEGSGFLYKMVRNITGTLLEVGSGKRSPRDIETILSYKDRTKSGKSAEACGLFLMEVLYDVQKSSSNELMI